MRTFYFTVTGRGSFPFDMLRVTQSWPATVQDSDKITLSCPTQAPEQTLTLATNRVLSGSDIANWKAQKWECRNVSSF